MISDQTWNNFNLSPSLNQVSSPQCYHVWTDYLSKANFWGDFLTFWEAVHFWPGPKMWLASSETDYGLQNLENDVNQYLLNLHRTPVLNKTPISTKCTQTYECTNSPKFRQLVSDLKFMHIGNGMLSLPYCSCCCFQLIWVKKLSPMGLSDEENHGYSSLADLSKCVRMSTKECRESTVILQRSGMSGANNTDWELFYSLPSILIFIVHISSWRSCINAQKPLEIQQLIKPSWHQEGPTVRQYG